MLIHYWRCRNIIVKVQQIYIGKIICLYVPLETAVFCSSLEYQTTIIAFHTSLRMFHEDGDWSNLDHKLNMYLDK